MDKQTNKTENEYYSDGCRIEKTINNNGDVIKEDYFSPSGSLETTFKYRYNADGICIQETEYDSSGNLISKTDYDYDGYSNTIKKIDYINGKPEKKRIEINNHEN